MYNYKVNGISTSGVALVLPSLLQIRRIVASRMKALIDLVNLYWKMH